MNKYINSNIKIHMLSVFFFFPLTSSRLLPSHSQYKITKALVLMGGGGAGGFTPHFLNIMHF